MSGEFIPPGAFAEAPSRPTFKLLRVRAPIETLKRLPGCLEWVFECLQASTSVGSGAAIGNITPGIPTNYQVQHGFEALIDKILVGPNMVSAIADPTWNASLTANGVPIPGYAFFGRLSETDGIGNCWQTAAILIPENTLIELRKGSDGFGANPMVIGGWVHGFVWPKRAREEWEHRHSASGAGA